MAAADAAVQYAKEREQWEPFTKLLEDHIKHLLEEHGLAYHTVTSRTKSFESFRRKCDDGDYDDPSTQIFDKTGIRIVTHLQSECAPIEALLKEEFEVIPEQSPDKKKELGTDRMGYRSTNLVCKSRDIHCSKQRWAKFQDWPFEVQVRSLLDHAWAELSRSKSYRFSAGPLPAQLQRRFSLLAAVLELADLECDSIADAADAYALEVLNDNDASSGNLEIDAISLPAYIQRKFPNFWAARRTDEAYSWNMIVDKLGEFDCRILDDVGQLIPDGLDENARLPDGVSSVSGLINFLMILKDVNKFIERVWRRDKMELYPDTVALLNEYGLDILGASSENCEIRLDDTVDRG